MCASKVMTALLWSDDDAGALDREQLLHTQVTWFDGSYYGREGEPTCAEAEEQEPPAVHEMEHSHQQKEDQHTNLQKWHCEQDCSVSLRDSWLIWDTSTF